MGWTIRISVQSGQVLLPTITSRHALGPTQPSYSMVTGSFLAGLKPPDREARHSPRSNTEVKSAWSFASTSQYVFMVWLLGTGTTSQK
jgi:hypothetical protein